MESNSQRHQRKYGLPYKSVSFIVRATIASSIGFLCVVPIGDLRSSPCPVGAASSSATVGEPGWRALSASLDAAHTVTRASGERARRETRPHLLSVNRGGGRLSVSAL